MGLFLLQFEKDGYVNANSIELIGVTQLGELYFSTNNFVTKVVCGRYRDTFLNNLQFYDENKSDIQNGLRGE